MELDIFETLNAYLSVKWGSAHLLELCCEHWFCAYATHRTKVPCTCQEHLTGISFGGIFPLLPSPLSQIGVEASLSLRDEGG